MMDEYNREPNHRIVSPIYNYGNETEHTPTIANHSYNPSIKYFWASWKKNERSNAMVGFMYNEDDNIFYPIGFKPTSSLEEILGCLAKQLSEIPLKDDIEKSL